MTGEAAMTAAHWLSSRAATRDLGCRVVDCGSAPAMTAREAMTAEPAKTSNVAVALPSG